MTRLTALQLALIASLTLAAAYVAPQQAAIAAVNEWSE